MAAKTRAYATKNRDTGEIRVIRASSEHQARSVVAHDKIAVWIPSVDEALMFGAKGIVVEEPEQQVTPVTREIES